MANITEAEGVIKFRQQHRQAPLPAWADCRALTHWFGRMRETGLIGQDPHRYQGAAYGNISMRAQPGGFLVTGSQTGGLQRIDGQHICWVREVDCRHNRVVSLGPLPPSSESMTHAQIYQLVDEAEFVIHVHSPELWHAATDLGLACTPVEAAYGTPAMAAAVQELLEDPAVRNRGLLAMGGHEDGIISFAAEADRAGEQLLGLLTKF